MSKKFLIITGIILVLLVIGLAGYYFVFIQNQNTDTVSTTIQKTFNPFGQSDTTNSTTTDNTNNTTGSTAISSNQNDYTKKLREIWNQPVSGAGILDEKLGSTVSFVDKATGFVYKTELFSANQIRLSNTTIPLAYNAVWDGQNNSFVAQYLKDDNTVSTNVLSLKSGTTTDQTISGFSLGENIKSISVYGENIFYLQTYSDISKGFISTIDGKTKKQIWQSPLSELNSQIIDNAVVLTTKPYQNTAGFSYLINTTTGGIKKIIGNIDGLVTLVSNDASTVLYSSQNDFSGKIVESEYDVKRGYFYPVKIRYDKPVPNSCYVCTSNLKSILQPLTEQTIIGRACDLMRKYHNIVKSDIIKELSQKCTSK
jgi:uncharacterized protein YxeA